MEKIHTSLPWEPSPKSDVCFSRTLTLTLTWRIRLNWRKVQTKLVNTFMKKLWIIFQTTSRPSVNVILFAKNNHHIARALPRARQPYPSHVQFLFQLVFCCQKGLTLIHEILEKNWWSERIWNYGARSGAHTIIDIFHGFCIVQRCFGSFLKETPHFFGEDTYKFTLGTFTKIWRLFFEDFDFDMKNSFELKKSSN